MRKGNVKVGERYNYLTVIKKPAAVIVNGKISHYKVGVKCVCGKEYDINLSVLGKNKSCGCKNKRALRKKGEIFGGLKFLETDKKRKGYAKFECLVCGKVVSRNYYDTRSREDKSCGCVKEMRRRGAKKPALVNMVTLERLCKRFNLKLNKAKMTVNEMEVYYKNGRWLLKSDDTDITKMAYEKLGDYAPSVAESYRGIFVKDGRC